ncbi:unnamed protein product [Closterium sp. Naga37s-1]|nr:unnamed protein product [Closterium sp. Naga37s-1]
MISASPLHTAGFVPAFNSTASAHHPFTSSAAGSKSLLASLPQRHRERPPFSLNSGPSRFSGKLTPRTRTVTLTHFFSAPDARSATRPSGVQLRVSARDVDSSRFVDEGREGRLTSDSEREDEPEKDAREDTAAPGKDSGSDVSQGERSRESREGPRQSYRSEWRGTDRDGNVTERGREGTESRDRRAKYVRNSGRWEWIPAGRDRRASVHVNVPVANSSGRSSSGSGSGTAYRSGGRRRSGGSSSSESEGEEDQGNAQSGRRAWVGPGGREDGAGGRSRGNGRGLALARSVVIDLLARSKESVEDVVSPVLSRLTAATLWDHILRDLEHRGNKRRAYEVFEYLLLGKEHHGVTLSPQLFSTVITMLGRDGKLAHARAAFDAMAAHGVARGVHEFTSLLSGYARHGLIREAVDVLALMKEEGCEPNVVTYNALIHAHAKQGSGVDKVTALFDEMTARGVEPDAITYNTLINVCVRCRDVERALTVFNTMRQAGFSPNVITYTSLVDGLGKTGRVKEAAELFEEMKHCGQDPNSRTYNSLIRAYGEAGLYDEATSLFQEMERAGCMPDAFTYNTMINFYGRDGQVDEAEGVLQQMRTQGCIPDRVTYNTLMDAYAKAGHPEKAQHVLAVMRSAGVAPDLYTFNILLEAASKTRTIEDADRIYEEISRSGLRPNLVTFTAMINAYGRMGRHEEAQEVWRDMRAAGCVPGGQAYTGLINAYARHGMYEEAQQEAQRVFDEACRVGIDPDVRTYTQLMDAYGRAESRLSLMQRAGFVPDALAYAVLVRTFVVVDKSKLALSPLLVSLSPFPFSFPFFPPSPVSLPQEAQRVFDEACRVGIDPDVRTYTQLMDAYGRAESRLSLMQRAGFVPDALAYAVLVRTFVVVDKSKLALSPLLVSLSPFPFSFPFFPPSPVSLPQEAQRVFDEACRVGIDPDVRTYTQLMDAYGRAESRLSLMQRAGFVPDALAYAVLVRTFVVVDKSKLALSPLLVSLSPFPFSFPFFPPSPVSLPQEAQRVFDEACRVGIDPDVRTYTQLMDAYGRAESRLSLMQRAGFVPDALAYAVLVRTFVVVDKSKLALSPLLVSLSPFPFSFPFFPPSPVSLPQEAQRVFDEACRVGIDPDVRTYTQLMDAYGRAESRLSLMQRAGFVPDALAYAVLVRTFVVVDKSKLALSPLLVSLSPFPFSFPFFPPSPVSLPQEAQRVFDEACRVGIDPDVRTYTQLMDAYGRAESRLSLMQRAGFVPDALAYAVLVRTFVVVDKSKLALSPLLVSLSPFPFSFPFFPPSPVSLPQEAQRVFDEACRVGIDPDVRTYTQLMDAYGRAESRLSLMQRAGFVPDALAYAVLVRTFVVVDKSKLALSPLLVSLSPFPFSFPFFPPSPVSLPQEAQRVFDEACRVGIDPDVRTYTQLMDAYGRAESRLSLMQRAGFVPDALAYAVLVRTFVVVDKSKLALSPLLVSLSPFPFSFPFFPPSPVSLPQEAQRVFDEACRVGIDPDVRTYTQLMDAYGRAESRLSLMQRAGFVPDALAYAVLVRTFVVVDKSKLALSPLLVSLSPFPFSFPFFPPSPVSLPQEAQRVFDEACRVGIDPDVRTYTQLMDAYGRAESRLSLMQRAGFVPDALAYAVLVRTFVVVDKSKLALSPLLVSLSPFPFSFPFFPPSPVSLPQEAQRVFDEACRVGIDPDVRTYTQLMDAYGRAESRLSLMQRAGFVPDALAYAVLVRTFVVVDKSKLALSPLLVSLSPFPFSFPFFPPSPVSLPQEAQRVFDEACRVGIDPDVRTYTQLMDAYGRAESRLSLMQRAGFVPDALAYAVLVRTFVVVDKSKLALSPLLVSLSPFPFSFPFFPPSPVSLPQEAQRVFDEACRVGIDPDVRTYTQLMDAYGRAESRLSLMQRAGFVPDALAYAVLVRTFVVVDKSKLALSPLLVSLSPFPFSFPFFPPSPVSLPQEAQRVFDEACRVGIDPDVRTYTQLMDAYGRAESRLSLMQRAGFVPDALAYAVLVRTFVVVDKSKLALSPLLVSLSPFPFSFPFFPPSPVSLPQEAQRVFDEACRVGIDPDVRTYTQLMDAYGRAESRLSLMQRAGFVPDALAYAVLVRTFVVVDKSKLALSPLLVSLSPFPFSFPFFPPSPVSLPQEAQRVFDEACRVGIDPDVRTYTQLMDAYGRAESRLSLMQRAGFVPDALAYAVLVRTFVVVDKSKLALSPLLVSLSPFPFSFPFFPPSPVSLPQEAQRVFDEACRVGIDPDVRTYTQLMDAYGRAESRLSLMQRAGFVPDALAYAVLVRTFVVVDKSKLALSPLLVSLSPFPFSFPFFPPSPVSLPQEAQRVFDEACRVGIDPDVRTYTQLMDAYGRAESRLSLMQRAGFVPDALAYAVLVRTFVVVDKSKLALSPLLVSLSPFPFSFPFFPPSPVSLPQEAQRVFDEACRVGIDPDVRTYTQLMDAYGRAESRLSLMQRAGFVPDALAYAVLVRTFVVVDKSKLALSPLLVSLSPFPFSFPFFPPSPVSLPQEAQRVFDEACRVGIDPDVRTYTQLMDAYGRAESRLSLMQRAGFVPDALAYAVLVRTFVVVDKSKLALSPLLVSLSPFPFSFPFFPPSPVSLPQEAQRVFDEACRVGIDPDVRTYTQLMDAYGRAESRLSLMQRAGFVPDALAYAVLVRTFVVVDKSKLALSPLLVSLSPFPFSFPFFPPSPVSLPQEAQRVFDEACRVGIDPDVRTYTQLMDAYGRAESRLSLMQRAGFVPDALAYAVLVRTFVVVDKSKLALSPLLVSLSPFPFSFPFFPPSPVSLPQEAQRVFDEACRVGIDPDVRTYTQLMDAYGRAESRLSLMQRAGFVPDALAYAVLVRTFVVVDKSKLALSPLLVSLSPFPFSFPFFPPSPVSLPQEAQRVFDEACRVGIDPDVRTYTQLMDAYGRAESRLSLMQRAGFVPDALAYAVLVRTFVVVDKSKLALSPLLVSLSPFPFSFPFFPPSPVSLPQEAQRVFDEACRVGIDPDVRTYTQLMDAYGRLFTPSPCPVPLSPFPCPLHQEAQRVFDEACRVGIDPDVRTYTQLMDAYGRAGQYRRAESLLSLMQRAGFVPDALAYAVLVRAFAVADRFELALGYFEHVLRDASPESPLCQQLISDFGSLYTAYKGKKLDVVQRSGSTGGSSGGVNGGVLPVQSTGSSGSGIGGAVGSMARPVLPEGGGLGRG